MLDENLLEYMMNDLPLYTIFEVQNNGTEVYPFRMEKKGKWGFGIYHDESKYCRPIVTSACVYKTRKVAQAYGDALKERIMQHDTSPQRKTLINMLGETTAKTVDSVVKGSKYK